MGQKGFVISATVICLILLFFSSMGAFPYSSLADPVDDSPDLLQFSAGGHVLGFTPYSLYAASGSHALTIDFVNASGVQPVAESAGDGQDKVSALGKITYNDAWQGVDIVYSAAPDGICETSYYLDTPAAAGSIRLRYNRPASLDGQGNLVISFESGNMVESAPIAWQEAAGQRSAVQVKYVVKGDNEVSFALSGCRPDVPVVIDPTLTWNTFLGCAEGTWGYGMAVDPAGNVYITGGSEKSWGNPVRQFSGDYDAYAAMLSSSGALVWNTFLGCNSSYDQAQGISVDPAGNVYVAGGSEKDWGDPLNHYAGGPDDAFVAKLDTSGNLIWNTFLGGAGDDWGNAIVTDPAGNAYVAGSSDQTWGDPKRAFSGDDNAFVAKLATGGGLIWNTFLGSDSDYAKAIALGPAGEVYVTGWSRSTWGNPKRELSGDANAFVAKLYNGGDLIWNTFLGSLYDDGLGIAVDGAGNAYVTGLSTASWGNPVRPFTPGQSAFVAKVSGSGDLVWNTFLGYVGKGVAVDSWGNVYVTGDSSSTWGNPWMPLYEGYTNSFVAELDNRGALVWNAFMGNGNGEGVAVGSCGTVYVSGTSRATWGNPVLPFITGDDHNAFAARISDPRTPIITSFTPSSGESGTRVTITGANLLGATAVSFGGTPAASFTVNSNTQIAAVVGTGSTGKITIGAPCGSAVSAGDFTFTMPTAFITTTPHGSSLPGITATAPQSPVILPTVSVRSASLSATKVAPGSPVTVIANVVNTGMADGSSSIKVYVNGALENSQGVTVNSESSMPVTFTIKRSEPGTYSVYVGGTQAGTFIVDEFADPNIILYISCALIGFAFVAGMAIILRKRQAVK